jgi:small subunit ribosomal protein S16
MPVKIRLKRMGRRNHPFFRVIVQDGRKSTTGRFLETLGWYDPNRSGVNYELKMDRVDYWVGCGAQLSNTVNSLAKLARSGKVPKEKVQPEPEAAPVAEEAPQNVETPVAEEASAEVDAPAEELAQSESKTPAEAPAEKADA